MAPLIPTPDHILLILNPNTRLKLLEMQVFDPIDTRQMNPCTPPIPTIIPSRIQLYHNPRQIPAKNALNTTSLLFIPDQKIAPHAKPVILWYFIFQLPHITLLMNGTITQVAKHQCIHISTVALKASVTSCIVWRLFYT